LIEIFNKLAEVTAKGDEAIILVKSRFILKDIIESVINNNNND
jgi:hypothetical protein